MTTALTIAESKDLTRLEGIVVSGLDTFVQVAEALVEIRNRKLYRCANKSFKGYVKERFGFTRGRAYQLVDALEVSEVAHTGGITVNERQARQVLKIARHEPDNGQTRQDKLKEILARIKRDEADAKAYTAEALPEKDWRETAEAKLRGAIKAWAGRSKRVEKKLAEAWAIAMEVREDDRAAA